MVLSENRLPKTWWFLTFQLPSPKSYRKWLVLFVIFPLWLLHPIKNLRSKVISLYVPMFFPWNPPLLHYKTGVALGPHFWGHRFAPSDPEDIYYNIYIYIIIYIYIYNHRAEKSHQNPGVAIPQLPSPHRRARAPAWCPSAPRDDPRRDTAQRAAAAAPPGRRNMEVKHGNCANQLSYGGWKKSCTS